MVINTKKVYLVHNTASGLACLFYKMDEITSLQSGLLILRIAAKPYETRMAIHKSLRLGYNKPIGSQSEMK